MHLSAHRIDGGETALVTGEEQLFAHPAERSEAVAFFKCLALSRQRGETFGKYEYADKETVVFDPLPCWSHLPVEEQRRRVAALVQEIEEEARIRREAAGIKPLGVAAILAQDPTHRPKKLKKSPAPFVHAASKAVRLALWEAYATFVAAYRDAAEKLRNRDPDPPQFPTGCFPPALPFVGV